MANAFRSGSVEVPVGVDSFGVTGLSLTFDPKAVVVSIRQPTANADLVSAYVSGGVTNDGFTVVLSSPVSRVGYVLDYSVFSQGGVSPSVDGDALAVSYDDLKGSVARFLGYDVYRMTTRQNAEVDDIIQSGVRRYYYPPAMDGVDVNFEWGFLKLDGELVTTGGVGEYRLPDGFGRVCGQISVVGDGGCSIPIIPYGDIVKMRSSNRESGRPRFAAVVGEKHFGEKGQTKRIVFAPTPDKGYTLSFKCDADQGKIDPVDNPFPLGSSMHAELITESCLAVAEQKSNDEIGLHTNNFNALLVSTIQRDRKSGAQNYGRMSCERMW